MLNNSLYTKLVGEFVKPFRERGTIFTGFTYKNEKDGRIIYPRLMSRPEKGGLWCFYDRRGGNEHIILDDFINRYLSGTIIGVGGYYEDGTTTSITFSRKDLLKPNKRFSDFLLEIQADPRPNNQGSDDSSQATTNRISQSSNEVLISRNDSFDIDEGKVNQEEQISQLKADMLTALQDIDQRRLGEDVDAIVKRRVGQSVFRSLLEAKHGSYCHASKIDNRRLLIASHIVPWSRSTGEEKTDPDNGLLLAVNWDAVFDKGLICFDDQGNVLFSDYLDEQTSDQLGLDRNIKLREGILNQGRKKYLQRHRQDVFECWKKSA